MASPSTTYDDLWDGRRDVGLLVLDRRVLRRAFSTTRRGRFSTTRLCLARAGSAADACPIRHIFPTATRMRRDPPRSGGAPGHDDVGQLRTRRPHPGRPACLRCGRGDPRATFRHPGDGRGVSRHGRLVASVRAAADLARARRRSFCGRSAQGTAGGHGFATAADFDRTAVVQIFTAGRRTLVRSDYVNGDASPSCSPARTMRLALAPVPFDHRWGALFRARPCCRSDRAGRAGSCSSSSNTEPHLDIPGVPRVLVRDGLDDVDFLVGCCYAGAIVL